MLWKLSSRAGNACTLSTEEPIVLMSVRSRTSSITEKSLAPVSNGAMQALHFSIFIYAPKEKVWDTMLNYSTYCEWTKAFNPTSYYVGDWSEGSKMQYLGTGDDGEEMGMVSIVRVNRPHEFISIEHIGVIENGVEDTASEKAKKWAPAFENYTFIEKDGGTEVLVDVDITDEYKTMFEDMWPKALQRLKQLAEE